MNQINPYRRNCEIIKIFFSRPIFLAAAIVLLLFTVSNTALFIFRPTFLLNSTLLLSPVSLFGCIACFILFFKGRSKKTSVSFKAPLTLMQSVSIISITITIIFSMIFASLSLLLTVYPAVSGANLPHWLSFSFAITLLSVCIPVSIYFISLLRSLNSVKKSISSVFLYKNGSVFFAVISVILSAATLLLYPDFKELIHINNLYAFTKLITLLLATTVFILSAITGFMYNSYIKKHTCSIIPNTAKPVQQGKSVNQNESVTKSNPVKHGKPTKQEHSFPVSMWIEPEQSNPLQPQSTAQQPINFTPRSVFEESKNAGTKFPAVPSNDKFDSAPQNPYVKSAAPAIKRCIKCGRDNPEKNLFCGECGTKL